MVGRLHDSAAGDYGSLIAEFGFESPARAFNTLATAKRVFRRHLRTVLAEYCENDREAEEELQELKLRLARKA